MNATRYNAIKRYLKDNIHIDDPYSTLPNWKAETKKYKINKKGLLMRDGKPVLKKSDLKQIWNQFHILGHSGRDATWKKINARFYFWGGERWVRKKVSECVGCSHKKSLIWKAATTPLQPIKVYPKAFWRVNIDMLGAIHPTSETGNKYIILIVDPLTKFVEAGGNLKQVFYRRISTIYFYRRV